MADLVAVAERGGICLWLHGHRHHTYHVNKREIAPFPIICAGSATERGIWNYCEYTVSDLHLRAQVRRFESGRRQFQDTDVFELELKG